MTGRHASAFTTHVDSGDVRLLVSKSGVAGPTIVFVHGFPDTHEGWLPIIARLADSFRCIAYDVRGAGESTAPPTVQGYRIDRLVDDLATVLAHTPEPESPVHLVGHDWGSVQTWESVLRAESDPRLQGRIASYTTISGPAIGHLGAWYASARHGSSTRRRAALRQAAHSWYLGAFQIPKVPELVLRHVLADPKRAKKILGMPHLADTYVQDTLNGLGLYRANLRHAERPPSLRTDIPIQLIVPTRDQFLTPAIYADLDRWCSDLTRHDVDAGHWAPWTHADEVAALVSDFVLAHD